ncbi:MAG TPA: KTSC domain-containing protein [Verrucomicrobiae bacterium]|nr:KTSC domain-containing protein [Verrucomicrobiae bacterium]
MNLIPVKSSSIQAVGYDGQNLAVLFHTSDTPYVHRHVPHAIYVGLMRAASKGGYYNRRIRGRY